MDAHLRQFICGGDANKPNPKMLEFKMKNRLIYKIGAIILIIVAVLSYRIGHKNGCYDTIESENEFGVNKAKEGIGLSAFAWCRDQ